MISTSMKQLFMRIVKNSQASMVLYHAALSIFSLSQLRRVPKRLPGERERTRVVGMEEIRNKPTELEAMAYHNMKKLCEFAYAAKTNPLIKDLIANQRT